MFDFRVILRCLVDLVWIEHIQVWLLKEISQELNVFRDLVRVEVGAEWSEYILVLL